MEDLNGTLRSFIDFCGIDLKLRKRTIRNHRNNIERFLKSIHGQPITKDTIRNYLRRYSDGNGNTYGNQVKSLRVFIRDFYQREDLIKSFRIAHETNIPVVPKDEDVSAFYHALETTKERAIYLFFASSGKRREEVLKLTRDRVDLDRRLISPSEGSLNNHTKREWYSLFNEEAQRDLAQYLASRKDDPNPKLFPFGYMQFRAMWKKAQSKTGLYITPQKLRGWFCSTMGRLGVQDRYVDAFCGRVPRSVLAKHYTDYSPERLREVYERANLKVLE